MKQPIFTGVCTALVTPFFENKINYPLLEQLLRNQVTSGVNAIVLAGTTGEASTLSDREKDIIRMFFGINCREMTLEEIGDKFGLTRERVRQTKEKAIRRLRQNSRSKLLKSYLG